MNEMEGDISCYLQKFQNGILGMTGFYGDESIITGKEEVMKLKDKTSERFDSRERVLGNFNVGGSQITANQDRYDMRPSDFRERIEIMDDITTYEKYRSKRPQLALLVNTVPHIMFCQQNSAGN